ncbi:MAG: hypothetical protein U5M51_15500 [Emticicia sp.]|nr:hypothetical protein [Emticicia sp.]
MKTINFLVDLQQAISLQNLKSELNTVGVKAFTINYVSQQISIVSSDEIKDETINCAVKKAGFDCKCFKVCNHDDK